MPAKTRRSRPSQVSSKQLTPSINIFTYVTLSKNYEQQFVCSLQKTIISKISQERHQPKSAMIVSNKLFTKTPRLKISTKHD